MRLLAVADYVVPFTQGANGYQGCDAWAVVGRIEHVMTLGGTSGVPVQWRKVQAVKGLCSPSSSARVSPRFVSHGLSGRAQHKVSCHASTVTCGHRFRISTLGGLVH